MPKNTSLPPPLTPLRGGFRCRTSPMPLVPNDTHSDGYFSGITKICFIYPPPPPFDPPLRGVSIRRRPPMFRNRVVALSDRFYGQKVDSETRWSP